MRLSALHRKWKHQKREAVLGHYHEIVKRFIDQNDDDIAGDQGIRIEYRKVKNALDDGDWSEIDDRRFIRYGETAYLIWALGTKKGRDDILKANVANWGNGTDKNDGNGSNFRNLEFEAHTALRFLEEGFAVQPLCTDGKAEMVIEDAFVIECKRPTRWKGLFTNALKSRKQIGKSGLPGTLIFNLDNLEDCQIDLSSDEAIESYFSKLQQAAEHGLGNLDSEVFCVALEYVANDRMISNQGSLVHSFHNCRGKKLVDRHKWIRQISTALVGDFSLSDDLHPPVLSVSDRFEDDYDSSDTPQRDRYFSEVIDRQGQ